MCSVIILRRPANDWPLMIAANRDEMNSRPWKPPARHWPDRPEVVAGLDELAGGSWMGVNDQGLAVCILNRFGTLGPQDGKRSRGELVLEALDHADARDAANALSQLEPSAYRTFNLVIADNRDAFWLRNTEESAAIERLEISEGLHMLTAHDMDDTEGSSRIARHLTRFRAAPAPDPENGDWMSWEALLSDAEAPDGDPASAMRIAFNNGFQTVSSSLLALPSTERADAGPRWRFLDRLAPTEIWSQILPET